MLTSEAIEYFLAAKRAERKSPRTIEDYATKLWRFAKWAGDPDLSGISVILVRNYIASLQDTMRPVTVASYIRPLKVFCRFMVAEEVMHVDPFKRVKVPSFDRELHDLLSDDDFKAMLAQCDRSTHEGRRNEAILCFLYDTGVRVNELVNLRVSDLDMHARTALVLGKGHKERHVFFSAATAMVLTRFLGRAPAKYKGQWVFMSAKRGLGSHLTTQGVRQITEAIGRKAGVTSRTNPHTFRHTFATNYLRAGGDLNSLMRLMGHADLTILQTYLSLVTDDLRAKHDEFSPMARISGGKR